MTTAALRVIEPGLQSTLQDAGRHGYQRLGIPVSGALDWVSLRLANLLVGNAPAEACIEMSLIGPTLEVDADSVRVALVGTAGGIEMLTPHDGDGDPDRAPTGDTALRRDTAVGRVAAMQSVRLERGQRFRIAGFGDSAVAYLAIEGGFDIAPVMGSLSTHWRAQVGPRIGDVSGGKIARGMRLPLKLAQAVRRDEIRLADFDRAPPPRYRVVLGPQDDAFTPEQIATFLDATYRVSREADRWGLRLDGPALAHAISIVSDAIAPGAIQVPASGHPLVLLADRATTGGYPKIATVISADLPAMGRLTPGAPVAFAAVTVAAAQAARRTLEAQLQALASRLEVARPAVSIDTARLMSENLISGVVSGATP